MLLDAEPRTNLLRTAACSGATIADVTTTQLSQLNRGTTLVTVTAGANDLGAGDAYAICATQPGSPPCFSAVGSLSQLLASGEIAQRVAGLVGAISQRSPNAKIIFTDYPVPFEPGISGPGGITDIVNGFTTSLNAQIGAGVQLAAASGANVELASVVNAFSAHQVGDADPWLGGDLDNAVTFLHPTSAGQQAYRDAVVLALAN